MRQIALDKLLGAKRTRERDLVLAMIVERLIAPCSKLATTRMWHSTTLAQLLQVEDADEEALYAAMDWLLARHGRIEKRLAARHLGEGQQMLYDVSSSYYEGQTCPLVPFGHSRDGKRGKPIVVYGVLTDVQGRPVAVQIYPGNTGDPSTVADQVEKLKGRFGLERVVLVGERGMLTQTQIGQKVGKVINRHKVGKHFEVSIVDGHFRFSRRTAAIKREAGLDGLYVIRTSEPRQALSADDTVRSYKNLAQVERAFRTLKGADLRIRPIHHRSEERVRAHIFLCLLADYVEWHMRQALAPLLFDDQTLPVESQRRDPVPSAEPSASARRKKTERETEDGFSIHSFATLMEELGTRCHHLCRTKSDPGRPAFFQDTLPTPLQIRALELIRLLPVPGS
jgi:hypothetical protein